MSEWTFWIPEQLIQLISLIIINMNSASTQLANDVGLYLR